MLLLFTALALQLPAPTHAPSALRTNRHRPNIVFILADDLGVDMVGAYGKSASAPCTANIDALAAEGLLFQRAWSNPLCSPTRAQILTGRHGFRTGIGTVVGPYTKGLQVSETTIPERLAGYDTTYVGKWHLSGALGDLHPNESGFGHFAGFVHGAVQSYFNWGKVVDGVGAVCFTYATVEITNEAIAAIDRMQEPWFLYVAYNAPHSPFQIPPAHLCPGTGCVCTSIPSFRNFPKKARAATEAMDEEIGRLLAALDARDPEAYVIFTADNGTSPDVCEPPYLPSHAKGTVYEGGVNVPLVVRGPNVVHGECHALVSLVDVFATVLELGRAPRMLPGDEPNDSVSMVPYFTDPTRALRATVYAEFFTPNGRAPHAVHRRAVRDVRYKLIRANGAPDELYDLALDPFETNNRLPSAMAEELAAYDALALELEALGVD
ncbi:MAG: sulfatase-like hydrolase/transferase [Planctomycetota bacterium]